VNAQSKVERDVKLNIAQRINAAMAEVEYVQKQKPKDQGMKYSYVSHDAVTAKVRPILQSHGVVYYPRELQVTQNGNRTEAVFTVRFENIDDRTDIIDVATFGYGVDNQDKGPGKAISYGVKYALLKILGLETGDDPEAIQDERADFKPSNGETPPEKRVPPAGPCTSKTMLQGAVKALAATLENIGDTDELNALMETKDFIELEKQAARDLPSWWETGDGLPEEFVPMIVRIERKKKELEAAENQFNNTRTPIDAG
jgi:hypothetical protein